MLGAIDSGRMSETIWVYGYHGTSMERASAIVEAGFTPNTVRLSRVSTLISVRVGGLWLYSCGFNRHLTLNRTVLASLLVITNMTISTERSISMLMRL
jgi:hypothetical protein